MSGNDIPSLSEAFGKGSNDSADGFGMTTMPEDGGAGPKPGNDGGGKDDDNWLEVDDTPFSQFANDDRDLENAPDKQRDKNEIVFDMADDDDFEGDLDDFQDTRKEPDKKKRSRLQREINAKHEARENQGKLAGHTSRLAKEAETAMKMEMKANQRLATFVYETTKDRINRIDAELAAAQENGDTGKIRALTEERTKAAGIVTKAQEQVEKFSDENIDAFRYDPKVPPDLLQPNGGGTSRGRDWMDANSEWFNNPQKYGAEIAAAKAIDSELAKDKRFDINSDAYYMELTRRVKMKFADLEVHTLDGRVARIGERQRGGAPQQRRDPTGSSSMRGSTQSRQAQPRNGGAERINPEEKRMLERMGIDFNNKDHIATLKAERVRNPR